MGADQKQTCVTPAYRWQRTSILLTASAQRRKASFSSFTPPLLSYSSSPLSSALLMGPLCHLLVYSVLSRYPPGSLLLYYLVRNSALCVVCVQPLSGLLYCKKELMCNWRPKVWSLRSSGDLYLLLLWMSSAFYPCTPNLLRITCSMAESSALVAHIIAHHRCPNHTAVQHSRLVIVKTRGGCERRLVQRCQWWKSSA